MAALPTWIDAHDRQALAFERRAVRSLTGRLRDVVGKTMRELAAEYVQLAGGLDVPVSLPMVERLRSTIVRLLLALSTGFASEIPALIAGLLKMAAQGVALGVKQAVELLDRRPKVAAGPSQELVAATQRLAVALPEQMAKAVDYAQSAPLASWNDATTAIAMAGRAVNTAEQATRWIANRAIAEGSSAVAVELGVGRMWVAERNACLTCLAYSGEVAPPGQPFPAGLTFGKTSSVKEPIWAPPAHPSCRCSLKPWLGVGGPVDISTALKREAQRSVLRGDSAYDSKPARLRAAKRLLDTGLVGTSETAKKRARRAIDAGAFPDRSAARPKPPSP